MSTYEFDEPEGLDIRYTEPSDANPLREWLEEPGVLRWFPMIEPSEIEDSIARWVGFHKYKSSLTATFNGEPCGLATLYIQPYKKLAHQTQFGIIVSPKHRNMKVGSVLLKNLIHLAKNYFNIELLHLEVYEGNPAKRLYERFGFTEFGEQKHWIKDEDGYVGRTFMEKEI